MLIGEPPPSQADLHFRIFNIPVRVHPFFWIVAVLLGVRIANELDQMLIWVTVVFVSILVHELGHALMARRFGQHPWITLYGMGGLASYQGSVSPRERILILAAGPGAGFALVGLVVVGLLLAGKQVQFVPSVFPIRFEAIENLNLNRFVSNMLIVNIFWGVLNLLPVYPLDGGQITRELMVNNSPRTGITYSLYLSVFTGGLVAIYALTSGQMFMGLMFGFLAFQSYSVLQHYSGRGGW